MSRAGRAEVGEGVKGGALGGARGSTGEQKYFAVLIIGVAAFLKRTDC